MAALKIALMDEQQVLGLDPHIACARADTLLGESLCPSLLFSGPDADMSRAQPLR